MQFRKGLPKSIKRLVIKLGTRAVTKPEGGIDLQQLHSLLEDILHLKKTGVQCILVCSGAIHTARPLFPKNSNPKQKADISELQALSSVGQILLISEIQSFLKKHSTMVGQLLLTHEDFKHSTRYHNLKSTIETLLKENCLPVINENDSISFSEITVGDNDQLAAMIAENLEAQALLMMSETDGLFTKNPKEEGAEAIPFIPYHDSLISVDTKNTSSGGRGGMLTKLQAVRKLTPLGVPVVIASFQRPSPILKALSEDACGSLFEANIQVKSKKQARILTRVKTNAEVRVDSGAADALQQNKSLLPVGVTQVLGSFIRGDVIKVVHNRKILAYGIAEYGASDLKKFLDKKGKNLASNLPSKVFIHKNNLIQKDSK